MTKTLPIPYSRQLTSAETQEGHSTQSAPTMMMDRQSEADRVELWLCSAEPLNVSDIEAPIVEPDGTGWIIRNGNREVKIPGEKGERDEVPLWIQEWRLGKGKWTGCGTAFCSLAVTELATEIESRGEAGIQWSTVYQFEDGSSHRYRIRWASGADTLEVEEFCHSQSGKTLGYVDWHPAGSTAEARTHGGGERGAGMSPLNLNGRYPSCSGNPEEACVDWLGHISYWGQSSLSWIGFSDQSAGMFAGIFPGWGDLWENRESQWIEVMQEEPGSGFLRFPVAPGRRGWGLLLTDPESADPSDRRCLLNRRKAQFSDLAPVKVDRWDLESDDSDSRLFDLDDVKACRDRLSRHPNFLKVLLGEDVMPEVRLLLNDDPAAAEAVFLELSEWAEKEIRDICDGGYERLIIFDGRLSKKYSYSWTLLRLLGKVPANHNGVIPRVLLMLAAMMEDPAFCLEEDFYGSKDTLPKQAIKMGPTPVPPNFWAEYLTTVGVTALTFPGHSRSEDQLDRTVRGLQRFIERFIDEDGAYRESLNYHTHTLVTLIMFMQPLREAGGVDFFAEDRIRKTFAYLCSLQMPELGDQPPLGTHPNHFYGCSDRTRFAPLPANGNSGGNGHEMTLKPDPSLGAWIYREANPELSRHLMASWDRGGRLLCCPDAAVLTVLTLDPELPKDPIPPASFYSPALGLVSRFSLGEEEGWALVRAGDCTHHMDFDQGHIHLALAGEVILGDYGYHAKDQDGHTFHAAATRRHSTVTCHQNPDYSHAYTGLEEAPRAHHVRITDEWDFLVHRIEVNNYRDLSRLPYNILIPADTPFVHIRKVLVLKQWGGIFIHDEFEGIDGEVTWRLFPRRPLRQVTDREFSVQTETSSGFRLHFLNPHAPVVTSNGQQGQLAEFACQIPATEPIASFIVPEDSEMTEPNWEPESQRLSWKNPTGQQSFTVPV